jgi:hypothetical protein
MFKKNPAILFLLFSAIFIFNQAGLAQDSETASSSNLTGVALPAGAQRILPGSVPAEVKQAFDKITAAGDGKFQQGESEVLVWAGSNYRQANAASIVNRLTGGLKSAGWQYAEERGDNGLTIFTVVKEGAGRRALVGFHGATDDALIFSWMEILPAGGSVQNRADNNTQFNRQENAVPVGNTNGGGSIVGTYTNGTTSMLGEKNQVTGVVTSRNGSTYKYVFHANGSFEFIGYMESTMYGCTTSLFNDKRGNYRISGSQITLTPSKNYWKNMYSCAPNSNKEKNHTLEQETYSFRTKQDEYGKTLICLANEKGESCYRREN